MSKPHRSGKYALVLSLGLVATACAHAPSPPPTSLDAAVSRAVEAWRGEDLDALLDLTAADRRDLLTAWTRHVAPTLAVWTIEEARPGPRDTFGPGTVLVLLTLAERRGAARGCGRLLFVERDGEWWLLDL